MNPYNDTKVQFTVTLMFIGQTPGAPPACSLTSQVGQPKCSGFDPEPFVAYLCAKSAGSSLCLESGLLARDVWRAKLQSARPDARTELSLNEEALNSTLKSMTHEVL